MGKKKNMQRQIILTRVYANTIKSQTHWRQCNLEVPAKSLLVLGFKNPLGSSRSFVKGRGLKKRKTKFENMFQRTAKYKNEVETKSVTT